MHREQRNVHFGLVRATRQARTGVRTPSSALPVLMPGKGKTPPSKATPDSDSPPDDSEEEEETEAEREWRVKREARELKRQLK